jgi:hypothetical protein
MATRAAFAVLAIFYLRALSFLLLLKMSTNVCKNLAIKLRYAAGRNQIKLSIVDKLFGVSFLALLCCCRRVPAEGGRHGWDGK